MKRTYKIAQWKPECLKNLREALREGAESLEEIGGFVEQRQVDQFIRDVRQAADLMEPDI